MRLQCQSRGRAPDAGSRCQSTGSPKSRWECPRKSNCPWRARSAFATTRLSRSGQRLRRVATTSVRWPNAAKKRGVVRARKSLSRAAASDDGDAAHPAVNTLANVSSGGTRISGEIPARSDHAASHCRARTLSSATLRPLSFVQSGVACESRLI